MPFWHLSSHRPGAYCTRLIGLPTSSVSVTRCSRLTSPKSHWEQVEIQRGTPHLRRACCISNDVAKKRADQSLQFQMFLELESNESIDNDFEGWYSDWTPVLCPRNWSALPWGLHAWEKSSGRRFRDAMTQLWRLTCNWRDPFGRAYICSHTSSFFEIHVHGGFNNTCPYIALL